MTHPATPRAMVIVNGDDIHHDLLSAAQVFQQLGVEAGFTTRRAMGTHRFVDPRMYQPLADEMGVAFLGVSGTTVRGRRHFVWSEDPVKDLERIEAAA